MMMPFSIAQPRRILFGRGQAQNAVQAIAGHGRRVFLVHGRDAQRAEWLVAGLRRAGMTVIAQECAGEPSLPALDEAVRVARSCDVVTALGGGSAVDLGKAVAALVPTPGDAMDYLEVVGRGARLRADPLPFVAIPTTAGTGAEVTKNAVIDVPEHRCKVSLRDDRMIADLAIIDPALTDACPRGVTLASGLDAIVQVIEPYLSIRANAYTDALCRAAIPQGLAALIRLMATDEDAGARDQMAWVSLSGGLALANAGLGAVHGFAGAIGGMTGAPHGAICGALLPHVLRANSAALPSSAAVMARFEDVRGWISEAFGVEDGIATLERWMHDNGLPRLSGMGVLSADHRTIAQTAMGASSMKANPTSLSLKQLEAILEAAA